MARHPGRAGGQGGCYGSVRHVSTTANAAAGFGKRGVGWAAIRTRTKRIRRICATNLNFPELEELSRLLPVRTCVCLEKRIMLKATLLTALAGLAAAQDPADGWMACKI